MVRLFFSSVFALLAVFFCTAPLFAVPLEGGYSLAPRSSAPEEEKAAAYMNARRLVIEASQRYLGTPYLHGGMTQSGLDCSGFICLSFKDALGISLPRSAAGIYTWTNRIQLNNAQPGDFLFFRTGASDSITHVGLYLGGRRFIHSASAGPQTGVIYSSIDEQYWNNAFAGAGRAFPEAPANFSLSGNTPVSYNSSGDFGGQGTQFVPVANLPDAHDGIPAGAESGGSNGRLLISAAAAPIWNGFLKGGELFRGFSSQLCLYADTSALGPRMVFGFEVRPEYDGALNVFRLPVTLSWGPNEKFRVFLGPVLSFGDREIPADGKTDKHSGGVNVLGVIGVTAAPFVISSPIGDFAPYAEVAWQTNIFNSKKFDLASDFSEGFKFATGIRWVLQIR